MSAVVGVRQLQQRFARAGYGPLLLARRRAGSAVQTSNMAWLEKQSLKPANALHSNPSNLAVRLLSQRAPQLRYTMPSLPNGPVSQVGATGHPPDVHVAPHHHRPTSILRQHLSQSHHQRVRARGVPEPRPSSSTPPLRHGSPQQTRELPPRSADQEAHKPAEGYASYATTSAACPAPLVPSLTMAASGQGAKLHMAPDPAQPRPKKPRVPSFKPHKISRIRRNKRRPPLRSSSPPPSTARSPRALSEADIAQAVQAARRRVQQQALVSHDDDETGPGSGPSGSLSSPRYTPQELAQAEMRLQERAAAVLAAAARQQAAAQLEQEELQAKLQQVAQEARAAAPSSPAVTAVHTAADAGQQHTTPPPATPPLGPDLPPGVTVPPWSKHGSGFTSPIRVVSPLPQSQSPESPGDATNTSTAGDGQSRQLRRRRRKSKPRPPRPISPIHAPPSPPAVDEASIVEARAAAARRVAQRRRELAMAHDVEADEAANGNNDYKHDPDAAAAARRAAAARVAARRAVETSVPRTLTRRELEAIQQEAQHEQQRRRVYALNALCRAFTEAQFERFDEQLEQRRRAVRAEGTITQ